MPKRLTHKQKIRQTLYNRQDGMCHYCYRMLVLFNGQENSLTIDHVHPRSLGGNNSIDNYVGACQDCNSRKGNKINYMSNSLHYVVDTSPSMSTKVGKSWSTITQQPKHVRRASDPVYYQTSTQLTDASFAATLNSMPVRQTIVKLKP